MQLEILPLSTDGEKSMWLASVTVPCGEPIEICTELEKIDLNEYLTHGSDGVYLIRVVGDSMETEIKSGDLIVVNRNLLPVSGDVIVASVNGSYTIKIYKPYRNGLQLISKNEAYKPRTITPEDKFEIFGVVTDVIHRLKKM
jgi:DNA polymerase V